MTTSANRVPLKAK